MNKLIVITGGSQGIGKAIVEKFASQGFDIVTCSRSRSALDVLAEGVNKDFPQSKIYTYVADVSEKREVEGFVNFIKGLKRPVDVLVNNAGVFLPGAVHKEEDGLLEKMIRTNLYSAYHITQGIAPMMMKEKKGSIFNMCSTASIMPYVNGGSYCISKFALYGFSKVLREEMKPYGIKVTAILPGATKTASWDGVDLSEERFIKAADIADAAWSIYTMSPNADVEEILIRPQLGDI